ncbi:hypothetical protein F7725_021878 [Dissostichus mawsoni]|uniref:Uncharacterized protein n=1 Tax=Dissostichus mawsoni TaxID=36200 RepID=A0A7J5ZEP4_DISMA|nr:hypothetical protein F7725_021878 [Dissostichus mawsoni]
MFDLKKSYSLIVNCSAEEFSRAAVRRKVRGAEECVVSNTVPPKPAHLQSPQREGPALARSPTAKLQPQQEQSPNRGLGCVSPSQNCLGSPSPIRGGGNSFLNVSGAHISPTRLSPGSLLGSPSPGKRGLHSRSPSREGGHSPAKLSPRNRSPLSGLLRTPSPVQGEWGAIDPPRTLNHG